MSEYREFTGKTVEEALRNAREAFSAGLDDLDFEILTPGSRGVLGMGAEPARIVAAPRSALGGSAPKREAAASQPLPTPPPREDRGDRYGDRDRDRGGRPQGAGYGDRDRGPRPGGYGDRGRGRSAALTATADRVRVGTAIDRRAEARTAIDPRAEVRTAIGRRAPRLQARRRQATPLRLRTARRAQGPAASAAMVAAAVPLGKVGHGRIAGAATSARAVRPLAVEAPAAPRGAAARLATSAPPRDRT